MKKRIISIILAIVLSLFVVAALTACRKGQKSDFEVPLEGYDGSEVTIKFYSSMGQGYDAILNDYIAEFNKLYPKIHIEHNRIGDYDSVRNQITTELGNGQSPNVAFCYSDHVALYNRSKSVVALDDLIASEIEVVHADETKEILGLTAEQKADFIQTYYNEGSNFGDGKMYMLPFAKSTELMYYNKTFFTKNGLEVPDHWFASDGKIGTATSDVTSMEYVLAAIKALDPQCVPLGYDTGANWLITLFEQFESGYTKLTGDHYIFKNQQNYDILEVLNRWYQSGYFTTKGLLGGNTYTSTYFTSLSSSEGKKSYISIGSSAGAAKQVPSKINGVYPFEVGVAMIPQKAANTPINESKVISQGPNICIFKSDNPQEVVASWLLVKFLVTNAEFEARYGMEAGYLPVIKSVVDLPAYANKINNADTGDNMAGMAAKLCQEYKEAFFVSPAFDGSSEARDQMDVLLNACVMLKGSPESIRSGIRAAFEKSLNELER